MSVPGRSAFVCSAALFALAVMCGQRAPAQTAAPLPQSVAGSDAAQIARGKALYVAVGCSNCHGYQGQGGIGPMSGPRIARPDLELEAFKYLVRNPVTAMPPYSEKVLTDAQVADIHAYLRTAFVPGEIGKIPMLQSKR